MNALSWNEIVDGKRGGINALFLNLALRLCSVVYRLAVYLRNTAYDLKLLRIRSLPCRVVSVGNIVVGGVGKTPLVRLLAAGLKKRGRRVAILSRGYGTQSNADKTPRLATDGKTVLLSAKEAGDEPAMLARELDGVVIFSSPDRARAGKTAVERFGVDLLILDDGFQHRKLSRDADILLLDGARPFGNGRLLPAGQLREPAKNIRRAQLIIPTRCETTPPSETMEMIRRFNRDATIITAKYEAVRLRGISDNSSEDINFLKGKRVLAFSGIARPDDFEKTLLELGAALVFHRIFPDHHYFDTKEIGEIIDQAKRANAEAIVTTAKDSVRIPDTAECPLPFLYLDIEMRIGVGEDKLLEFVIQLLEK